jgi:oligoribonuclease NrnB/cAMP/cGMP phosphodiesterase (DHH superfamily)
MKILIIYHAECPDGFAAAYVAHKAMTEDPAHQVTCVPAAYQSGKVPEFEDGTTIFVVDFSFPKTVLADMAKRAAKIIVLDHHKSAQADLEGADIVGVDIKFDMSKSGAVMAWEHFYPGMPVPPLLQYVQDRDLWHWKLPNSKEINAGLWRGTPREFTEWDSLFELDLEHAKDILLVKGQAIATSDTFFIESLCRKPQTMIVAGYKVPAVNTPVLQSEIGHHLLQTNPDAPFAVAWSMDEKNQFSYSLRARTGGFDVSAVAKQFGGGGHAAAAGFRYPELMTTLGAK